MKKEKKGLNREEQMAPAPLISRQDMIMSCHPYKPGFVSDCQKRILVKEIVDAVYEDDYRKIDRCIDWLLVGLFGKNYVDKYKWERMKWEIRWHDRPICDMEDDLLGILDDPEGDFYCFELLQCFYAPGKVDNDDCPCQSTDEKLLDWATHCIDELCEDWKSDWYADNNIS